MSLPKSMQPPQVHYSIADGIHNWDEFEWWASRNVVLWNATACLCGADERSQLRMIAYHLILENQQMKDAEIKRLQNSTTPNFLP